MSGDAMTQDSPVSGHDPATAGEAPGGPRYAIGTWIVSVAYFALVFDSRWYAHDDGGLAHSAWRVLSGQLCRIVTTTTCIPGC